MFATLRAALAVATLGSVVACAANVQQPKLVMAQGAPAALTSSGLDDAQLLAECRRVFDGKTFVGVIKNSDFPKFKSVKRELTVLVTVKGGPKTVNNQWICPLAVRTETDDRTVTVREFLFDGSVATFVSEHHRRSLTPEGPCVRYTGTSLSDYATVFSIGDSLLCPR